MPEPPPQKAKLTHLLKTTQLEQNSKLQLKHQQECELLEDIKNYAKARSEVEKEYGNALLKLTARFQKKELLPPLNPACENVPVLSAWKSILDSTEKCAYAHVVCSEKYKNHVYEPVKDCRTRKDANLKKCQDVVTALHSEITDSVRYLSKTKKQYFEHENLSQASQEKMQDVKERLQKNNIGIFKSKYDLEKSLQKLEQKCDENEENSTVSRNDYLLAIASANAHQKRYFEADIPEVIRVLDGNVYNQFRNFMTSICRTELDMTKAVSDTFTQSNDRACKVSREYDSSLFIQQNAVFEWGPMYTYEKCGSDSNSGSLKAENSNGNNSLNREARKCTTRIVRDRKQLKRLSKVQEGLQARLTSMKQKHQRMGETASLDEAGNKKGGKWDEDNPTSFRLGKVNEDMRKLETVLACSEARLQLLRDAQVDVNTWLSSAEKQADSEDRDSKNRRTPQKQQQQQRRQNYTATNTQQQQGQVDDDDDNDSFIDDDFCDDDDETFEDDEWDTTAESCGRDGQQRGHNKSIISTSLYDNISLPSSDKSRNYPISCTVSYPYEATRSDELTIQVGDKIEVVEDGDLDQWVKARDSSGNIGYVPEYYLQFPPPPTPAVVDDPHAPMYCEPPGENYTDTLGSSGSTTSGTSSLATQSISSGESNHDIRSCDPTTSSNTVVCLARAIYEYAACDDEQLSLPEGAIITILAKDDNGVDDGWWKGELNGRVGVFPSLVVEEMGQSSPANAVLEEPAAPTVVVCPDETAKFDFGAESPPNFKPPRPVDCRSAPPSPSNSSATYTTSSPAPPPPLPTTPRSTLPRPQHSSSKYHLR